MNTRMNTTLKLMVAGVVVLGMTGCQGTQETGHDKAVNAANDRWLTMRSGTMLKLAQQQFDTGDLTQAEKTLAEAISIDGKNPRLHVLAGRIGIEHGQLERAYQRLQTAIDLKEDLPEAHYYQGIVLQRWEQYDAALARYQRAYELQADNASFLLASIELLVGLDRVDEAEAVLKDKLSYFDQNAGIRHAMGQIQMVKRDFAGAADSFRQASVLRPDDLRIAEDLATAQIAAGNYTDAIRNLERLCAGPDAKDRRDLQQLLALAYLKSGRTDEAKSIYVRLTQSDSSDVESWVKLSELAWSQEDESGTLLAANRVMSLAPRRVEGYLLAGLVWQKRGRLDEALRFFDRAAEVSPENAEPVLLRGITLERAGRRSAAADSYAEALRRVPGDARAQGLLANVSDSRSDQP